MLGAVAGLYYVLQNGGNQRVTKCISEFSVSCNQRISTDL